MNKVNTQGASQVEIERLQARIAELEPALAEANWSLAEANWLIDELEMHEGAEGWSKYLRDRLDIYKKTRKEQ